MQEVDIRSRFEATGVVRLDRASTADQATAMRNARWQHAERVEPTGSQGDVVLTHLRVFHSRSPDTGTVPRLTPGKEIRRA